MPPKRRSRPLERASCTTSAGPDPPNTPTRPISKQRAVHRVRFAGRLRKSEEERRQEAGVVDERLLYDADFYDLKTILKKHWQGDFSDALGEWRRFEVLFDELAHYRDPDAHRRKLLPHQQSLVLGIAGDIRSRLVRWHSRRETVADCFPRIESARDSLGYLWISPRARGVVGTESKRLTVGLLRRSVHRLDRKNLQSIVAVSLAARFTATEQR